MKAKTVTAVLLLTMLAIPAAARNKSTTKRSLRSRLSWMWAPPANPAYTWMAIQAVQNSLQPLPYYAPPVVVAPVYQNNPVHCTTQIIGTIAYTNCY